MKRNIFYVLVLLLTALLLWQSEALILYTRDAIVMCYKFIIPGLFPFFVCSGLLIYSGFAELISKVAEKFMRPLFNVAPSGAAAFVLGIISGFPSGAICAKDLYQSGNLSKSEAERLLAFCNNSGPLFLIGSLGVSIYTKPLYGVILYIIHIVSSIIVGIMFSRYNNSGHTSPPTRVNTRKITKTEAFSLALAQASENIITVCFSIIFFSAVSRTILDLVPFSGTLRAIVYGLCEFSVGVIKISTLPIDIFYRLVLSSLVVGFSGVCVHLQVMSVTAQSGLSLKPYVLGKVLHSIIATVITAATLIFISIPESVVTYRTIGLDKAFMLSALFFLVSVAVLIILRLILSLHRPHNSASLTG